MDMGSNPIQGKKRKKGEKKMFKKKATLEELRQIKVLLGARIDRLESEIEELKAKQEKPTETPKAQKPVPKMFEVAYAYKFHDEQGKSHSQTRYIVVSAKDENDAVKEFAMSRCEGKILSIQRISIADLRKKQITKTEKAKIVKKLEPSENQRPWEGDL